MPKRKQKTQINNKISSLRYPFWIWEGYISVIEVMMLSSPANWGMIKEQAVSQMEKDHVWKCCNWGKATEASTDLTVDSQQDDHGEETHRPHLRPWQEAHCLWIHDEDKTWTCRVNPAWGSNRGCHSCTCHACRVRPYLTQLLRRCPHLVFGTCSPELRK